MSEIRNYDTATDVAEAAAENAVEILARAIEMHGSASWVLAGGTSPIAAYKILVKRYHDVLDWSKVTILVGDERVVPIDNAESNWGTITDIFDKSPELSSMRRVVPDLSGTAEEAATEYDRMVRQLAGERRFDLVWVGVGEDGHSMSLFPGNAGFVDVTEDWVIPVHNSPKPPSDRFSFSLKALEHVHELVIFAVGASKKDALHEARLKGKLPVAVVADTVEAYGGEVRWLYDDPAWGEK
ncbi:MAG: 6-phosphogluconolactonase [Candidatus Saccharimonadales bacterium]